MPDGSKQETKVFAGGAVIAKQSGANEVGLTTADPVTGTTANLGYTAELGNIGTTEETEPLGQKLRQHDPDAPPEPQPNENRIGQCRRPALAMHIGCRVLCRIYWNVNALLKLIEM